MPNSNPFGVVLDSHANSDEERAITAAAGLGVKNLRILIPWADVEPTPGHYRFEHYDHLIRTAMQANLDVMVTLAFCPAWASSLPHETPDVYEHVLPREMALWSRFVGTVVRRYHSDVRYWQIWERPDINNFRGTTKDYLELLAAAHAAAKKADPLAAVFAAEPGGIDLGFIAKLCEAPNLDSFEGIALAPEVDQPERAAAYLHAVRDEILGANPQARKLVFITQWSSPDAGSAVDEASADRQASFMARAFVVAAALGVQRVYWSPLTDIRNADTGTSQQGLLDAQYQPRPAALALKRLATFMPEDAPAQLFTLAQTAVRLVAWRTQGAPTRAILWSAYAAPHLPSNAIPGVSLGAAAQPEPLLNAVSAADPPAPADGEVEVGTDPLLLDNVTLLPGEIRTTKTWFVPPVARTEAYLDFTTDEATGGIFSAKFRSWRMAGGPILMHDGRQAIKLGAAGQDPFLYCDVDDGYLFYRPQANRVEITVTATSDNPSDPSGFNVMYDSPNGYVFSGWQQVQPGVGWKDYVITLPDAYFANKGGYDFRISSLGTRQDVYVAKVTVKKLPD